MAVMDVYQVVTWQRGNYGIVDTRFEIADGRRRLGRGFRLKREAQAYARRLNRRLAAGDDPRDDPRT